MEMLVPLTLKIGGLVITGELLNLVVKYKRSLGERTDKGTAELKGFKELKKITGTGLQISDNLEIDSKYMKEHTAIIAPTGAGKTTKLYTKNLLQDNIKGSMVVLDPKGELFDLTSRYQAEKCGRKVYKFSPLEPTNSEGYNILEQCKDDTEVSQLAQTLLMNGALSIEMTTSKKAQGVEWLQMAEPLLTSALLYVRDLKAPFNTIEYAFKLIIDNPTKVLNLILGACDNEEVRTQYNIFKTVAQAENTAGSIKVTLASNLKLFTDKNINAVNSRTTFTAEEFRKEPSILYITFPERKSAYLAPYIAPFLNQFIDKLMDSHNKNSLTTCTFFIDEFPNIGIISNMALYCATVRSRDISFILCMQSLTQLYNIYGIYNAKAIFNNLKTKIFLPGISDQETLTYIETMAGKMEIKTVSESVGDKNKTTLSTGTTTRNVFNCDEARRIGDNECIIISGNNQPVKDTQTAYYNCVELVKEVKEPIEVKGKVSLYNNNKGFRELIAFKLKEIMAKMDAELEKVNEKNKKKSDELSKGIF